MHKRRIYRRLRTGGLCCHVPARLASLGLDYAVCSPSPRTSCTPASFGQGLAELALAFGSWLSLLTMSPSRYSHRELPPHKLGRAAHMLAFSYVDAPPILEAGRDESAVSRLETA